MHVTLVHAILIAHECESNWNKVASCPALIINSLWVRYSWSARNYDIMTKRCNKVGAEWNI